jgi:hypothetical protein
MLSCTSPPEIGCPLIGQSRVDGSIIISHAHIIGHVHNVETRSNEKDGEDI